MLRLIPTGIVGAVFVWNVSRLTREVRDFEDLRQAFLEFANKVPFYGAVIACADDPHLLNGLNVHAGQLTYEAVGTALGMKTVDPKSLI